MNEVLRAIASRRRCRRYRSEPLREADLAAILEAGTWAASGMGAQPAVLVAVQDPETRAQLQRLNAAVLGGGGDPFYGAPTVVAVLADPARSTCVEDGSLVIGNLMLAASALGVGSCWIHRAREVFAAPEGKALLRAWGVPEHYIGVGHCILGYPDGSLPAPKPRRPDAIRRV